MKTSMSAVALIAALTAGIVIGISFLAQPVKFTAAEVSLAQQVRIGSVIFHASHKVQAALLVALAISITTATGPRAVPWAVWAAAVAALAAQVLLLMPPLDTRVAAISAEQSLPPLPWLHAAYAGLELAKVVALLGLACLAARSALPDRFAA
jgi:hypothetical protein